MINRSLSLLAQRAALERHYAGGRTHLGFAAARSKSRHMELRWWGEIVPTAISARYSVRIRYRMGGKPVAEVLRPSLEVRHGSSIPHRYPDGSLCLFYPAAGEWQPSMPIADTIVPWTSEWLAHYEIWLACGSWRGGGIEH